MALQVGFWDVDHRLQELSAHGDPLEKLAATVNFEMFRADLTATLGERDPAKGGHPGFDPILKFRMLVLQTMHGLSLDQTEYLLRDRLSWMRFCRLGPGEKVPDANTLWDFREALIAANAFDSLFERLNRAITEAGYLPMSGQIVDATLVAAPRQRNTEEEKVDAPKNLADMKTKYEQLISTGKCKKLAITAVMRKLIVTANALLRDQRKWTQNLA